MAVAITALSPSQVSPLPVIHLILLLDSQQVLIVEGISYESEGSRRSGGPWRWRVISCFTTESLSRERHPSPPYAPRFFPDSLKEIAKKKRSHRDPSSLNDPSLPLVYSLSSMSLPSDSTRYALIVNGALFVFDWMAVADHLLHSPSTDSDYLISRIARGTMQKTQGWSPKLPLGEEESKLSSPPNIHLATRKSSQHRQQVC
jgi:hypothetical protein